MPLDFEATDIAEPEDFELQSRAREGQASETFLARAQGQRPLGNGGELQGIAKRDLVDVRRELEVQTNLAAETAKLRLVAIREELNRKLESELGLPEETRTKIEGEIRWINNKARNDWEDFDLGGFEFSLPDHAADEELTRFVSLRKALAGQRLTAETAQPLIRKPLSDPDTGEFNPSEDDLRLLTRAVASSTVDQLLGTRVLAQEKFGIDDEDHPVGISVQVDGMGAMGNLPNGKTYFLDIDYSAHQIQKGLYDLEALDYITGQIDRHAGNIFIDPDTGEVRGIDNDLAFPQMSRGEMLSADSAPSFPVRNLPLFMHEETARKIESLKPDDLRRSLADVGYPPGGRRGRLTAEEIEGAVQRLGELQKHVRNLRAIGHVVSQFTRETYDEAVKHQQDASTQQLRTPSSPDITFETATASDLTGTAKTSYIGTIAVESRVNQLGVASETAQRLGVEELRVALDTPGKAVRDPARAEFSRLAEERRLEQRNDIANFRQPEANRLAARLKSVEERLDGMRPSRSRDTLEEERAGVLQEIRAFNQSIDQRADELLEADKETLWEEARRNADNPELRRGPKPQDPTRHFGSFEPFVGKTISSSGGATGSGRVKVDDQYYQLKSSIAHSSAKRRIKAGGLNHENYGEVISSNIAKALVGDDNRGLIPEVQLRQDAANHEPKVTSKYLAGGRGDLDDLYRSEMQKINPALALEPKGKDGKAPIIDETGHKLKHARITLEESDQTRPGVLKLDGDAAQDVRRNIALSALLGDHDVNPGNMIALEGGRVGRIDFGHAFNELITGMGGKMTGGGGVGFEQNRILDFFNREKVSGARVGGDPSKLWRDYAGIGPSAGMTQALREVAASTEARDGLAQAKVQFADLIVELEAEDTPEARQELEDLTRSLARISKNIGKPVAGTDPGDVVREVFQNLDTFVRDGQRQMEDAADLCDLQTRIDTFLRNPANEGRPLPEDITAFYTVLSETPTSTVKAAQGEGLQWMKSSADTPAFTGNLENYVQARRHVLRLERGEGVGLNEIERLEQRKAQLEQNRTLGDRVTAAFKHGRKGVGGEIEKLDEQIKTLRAAVKEAQSGRSVDDDRIEVAQLKEGARLLERQIREMRQGAQLRIANQVHGIQPGITEQELAEIRVEVEKLEGAHRDLVSKIKAEEKVISVREKLGIKPTETGREQALQLDRPQDPLRLDAPLELPEERPDDSGSVKVRGRTQSVRESMGRDPEPTQPSVDGPKRRMTM